MSTSSEFKKVTSALAAMSCYLAGKEIVDIAKQAKVSQVTVTKWLKLAQGHDSACPLPVYRETILARRNRRDAQA